MASLALSRPTECFRSQCAWDTFATTAPIILAVDLPNRGYFDLLDPVQAMTGH
eukprot:gene11837-3503_t